jgi:mRNA-degrading endonuclease toxin of MazEF toxin-antitoxin module
MACPKPAPPTSDHVQTVAKAKVGPFIATLDDRHMEQVKTALLFALGF